MHRISLIFMGAIAGVGLTLTATHPRVFLGGSSATAASAAYQQLNLFGDVYERVRADYVEKPDDSKLVESAINGMLAGFGPHSSYMDPGSLRDLQVQTRSEFGGLGIEVTMEDGLVKVVAPIDDGQRHHHQARRRAGVRPDPQSGGPEDARPGEPQNQAHHHTQRSGQADRRVDHA